MGLFTSTDEQGRTSVMFLSAPGDLPGIAGGNAVAVTLDSDKLIIKQAAIDKPEIHLPLDRIMGLSVAGETVVIDKGPKSVLGRAIVGGALFGTAGAVIGGIDGCGRKVKKQPKQYLEISYQSAEGRAKSLRLEIAPMTIGAPKLARELRACCPRLAPSDTSVVL